MARGFGATLGVASTDKIVSALTAHATQRTYAFRFYHRAGNSRIIAKQNSGGVQVEQFLTLNATDYSYLRAWSGGDNVWIMALPALGAWHHLAITYDAGNVANDPLFYLDGLSQTVTQTAGPTSGSPVTNTDNYYIGNRGGGDRVVDGILAEFAIWDRILTQEEITGLGTAANGFDGKSPLYYPTSLVEYIKMDDNPVTSSVLANPTVTGTAQQTHLNIDYPGSIHVTMADSLTGEGEFI